MDSRQTLQDIISIILTATIEKLAKIKHQLGLPMDTPNPPSQVVGRV